MLARFACKSWQNGRKQEETLSTSSEPVSGNPISPLACKIKINHEPQKCKHWVQIKIGPQCFIILFCHFREWSVVVYAWHGLTPGLWDVYPSVRAMVTVPSRQLFSSRLGVRFAKRVGQRGICMRTHPWYIDQFFFHKCQLSPFGEHFEMKIGVNVFRTLRFFAPGYHYCIVCAANRCHC